MKVVMMSRYDQLGASSRLRMFQYRAALEAQGLQIHCEPLFSDAYLRAFYAGKSTRALTISAMRTRTKAMLRLRDADVIWLEKEALPWVPWLIERQLMPRGAKVIADYDDAVFHNYDLHKKALVRRVLGQKIDRVMQSADVVTAGNAYLAQRAEKAGARKVEVVPTVVDGAAYSVARRPDPDGRVRIGWIGSPSTWRAYMDPMLPLLLPLARKHDALLRAVGAAPMDAQAGLELIDWSEAREIELIQGMDIGVMPLDDSPWARGKCGYKLIQYMACGVPVVASPVGVNSQIVTHGVNGFLASTDVQWREAIDRLLGDAALRQRMGKAGRDTFETQYSLQIQAPRIAGLMHQLNGTFSR
ncbi:MAG: glycosyltransferase family 4 protein [Maritimibacter sp.]